MTMEKCGNGHLIFSTPLGKGCMKPGCVYRVPRPDVNGKKPRKPREITLPPDVDNET